MIDPFKETIKQTNKQTDKWTNKPINKQTHFGYWFSWLIKGIDLSSQTCQNLFVGRSPNSLLILKVNKVNFRNQ